MSVISIATRCRSCGRQLRPSSVRRFGYASICESCLESIEARLDEFLSRNPDRCDECGRLIRDMECDATGNIFMFVHMKDGVFQILCDQCSVSYAVSRKDIYGGAPWLEKHIRMGGRNVG